MRITEVAGLGTRDLDGARDWEAYSHAKRYVVPTLQLSTYIVFLQHMLLRSDFIGHSASFERVINMADHRLRLSHYPSFQADVKGYLFSLSPAFSTCPE